MTRCPPAKYLLVLPRLCVQNANAVSGPLTHGFPSITAFLGLSWALSRKARAAGLPLSFASVGVVCHRYQEQTTQGGFFHTFRLTRNPPASAEQRKLIEKDGGFKTPAIVEEGRIHLEISLVFGVLADAWDDADRTSDASKVMELLSGMRIAGGTVLPVSDPQTRRLRPWVADLTGSEEDRRKAFRDVCLRLLPGSALVARDDLLEQRWAELCKERPETSRLEAWLSLSRINWRFDPTAADGQGSWQHDRHNLGWVVPIPVGYGALGELRDPGSVANARDTNTPFRFVESLYSVGEWIGAHRLRQASDLLWYADSRPEEGFYRCRNDYQTPADSQV